jgi:hypothetical protein
MSSFDGVSDDQYDVSGQLDPNGDDSPAADNALDHIVAVGSGPQLGGAFAEAQSSDGSDGSFSQGVAQGVTSGLTTAGNAIGGDTGNAIGSAADTVGHLVGDAASIATEVLLAPSAPRAMFSA